MSVLTTEFPVSTQFNRSKFAALVVSWLRGASHSVILDENTSCDLDRSSIDLKSQNGESLTLRELEDHPQFWAIGFRYDNPAGGLLWRTEGVLRKAHTEDRGWLRVKTQCIATASMEPTHFPRKPFLIKSLIQDGYAGVDGIFGITDKPIWLQDPSDLDIAQAIVEGTATSYLPVVYISAATGSQSLLIDDLAKLAYDLGGIAHVVIEPSRNFSFALRDRAQGRNVYDGHVGIFLPNKGFQARIAPGDDKIQFREKVRSVSLTIRSQMPQYGWDWADFQEANIRTMRLREKSKLSTQEMESLYIEEIQAMGERIASLEEQLAQRPIIAPEAESDGVFLSENLPSVIGPQMYEGEFSDRVKYAIGAFLTDSEAKSVDRRTIAVLNSIQQKIPVSQELTELRSELRRAIKDPKKAASALQRLFERHGYSKKSDNGHPRLESRPGYIGLDAITLSKTPSDVRALKNMISDIEKVIGLNRMGAPSDVTQDNDILALNKKQS